MMEWAELLRLQVQFWVAPGLIFGCSWVAPEGGGDGRSVFWSPPPVPLPLGPPTVATAGAAGLQAPRGRSSSPIILLGWSCSLLTSLPISPENPPSCTPTSAATHHRGTPPGHGTTNRQICYCCSAPSSTSCSSDPLLLLHGALSSSLTPQLLTSMPLPSLQPTGCCLLPVSTTSLV